MNPATSIVVPADTCWLRASMPWGCNKEIREVMEMEGRPGGSRRTVREGERGLDQNRDRERERGLGRDRAIELNSVQTHLCTHSRFTPGLCWSGLLLLVNCATLHFSSPQSGTVLKDMFPMGLVSCSHTHHCESPQAVIQFESSSEILAHS